MKVVYTDEALRDLDDILKFLASNYPTIAAPFKTRLSALVRRIGKWAESAQEIEQRPGIRLVPLIRYPYKVFYQIRRQRVEILHIHHSSQE